MSFSRLILTLAAPTPFLVAIACSSSIQLPPAVLSNILDTVTIYALQGTQIGQPSGFDVTRASAARTDRGEQPFDFAYDLRSGDSSVILTLGVLGLAAESGIQMTDKDFPDVREAPLDDYETDSTMTVRLDDVFLIRSRSSQLGCDQFIGALPRYGKFQVIGIDPNLRQITLQHVVNLNCGYRSLELGVPTT